MTDSNDIRQPAAGFPAKPYTPPALHDLGTIGAVTAGPNNGSLDQLGGASGGFLVAQGTS
ncbi:MAG: hypothetical protein Rubg2KO_17560 [Rubricoccaceae bacterium]